MGALTEVVAAGKARFIGFSEWPAERISEALSLPGVARFVSSQPQYSALYRVPERELFPLCARHGIGQVVWSPLAQGVLSGKYRRGEPPPGDARAAGSMGRFMGRLLRPKALDAVAALEPIAREAGLTMAQLALAWVLRSPYVTSAIAGATRPEQVLENAAAADVAPLRRRRRRRRRGARAGRRALEERLGGGERLDPEAAAGRRGGVPELVEALLGRGPDEPLGGAEHAAVRDPRAALAARVAVERLAPRRRRPGSRRPGSPRRARARRSAPGPRRSGWCCRRRTAAASRGTARAARPRVPACARDPSRSARGSRASGRGTAWSCPRPGARRGRSPPWRRR